MESERMSFKARLSAPIDSRERLASRLSIERISGCLKKLREGESLEAKDKEALGRFIKGLDLVATGQADQYVFDGKNGNLKATKKLLSELWQACKGNDSLGKRRIENIRTTAEKFGLDLF
ncbi:MAG: hypothetical protein N3F07_01465 [Candidatus Micrarchaeota archaeon]|nr:hypothetical protein [Candidatus Micrarchaeota archaeon]